LVNDNQDPEILLPATNYALSDGGVLSLPGWFTLKAAGEDFLGAYDFYNPNIKVAPPASLSVLPGPPALFKVSPYLDTTVGAGSNATPGRQPLTAQLTDAYDNYLSSAGINAYMEVASATGTAGLLQYQVGVSWFNIGASTMIPTDANGMIGVSVPLVYKVSSRSGDSAIVWTGTAAVNNLDAYIARKQNTSGILTTTGGTPSKLVFISSQAAASVGKDEALPVTPGAQFTVQRRDDFDNVTQNAPTTVVTLTQSHTAVHAGRVLGRTGTVGDYGFRNITNDQFIEIVSIFNGQSQASFRYHDRMSSYSGVAPSSNTAEGGRPGYWRLQATSGVMQAAVHLLRMDPLPISKVTLTNPQRQMYAGKVTDSGGNPQPFKAELRDRFDNPSVATETVRVAISTITRQDSPVNNYFAFSLSSHTIAASFVSTVAYADVPLDAYFTTFYYMDTTASSVYEDPAATKPVIGVSVPAQFSWSGSTQAVFITPDYTARITVRNGGGQVLTAGVTSQMFTLAIEDRYANPTPVDVTSEDDEGIGTAFTITSNSGGQVKMASPDPAGFAPAPGSAKLLLGEATTSFYLVDTLVSEPAHQLVIDSVVERGWDAVVSSYVVIAAEPHHISFITPSRRLVAGTTVQYAAPGGAAVPTVVTVALKDVYNNTATTSSPVEVTFGAARETTYGGISPAETVSPSNSNWQVLKTNPVILPIPAGFSQASVYVWDTITDETPADAQNVTVGTTTIVSSATIQDSGFVLPYAAQDEYITPAPAAYFTLTHPYSLSAPLRVQGVGLLSLKARDRFGNHAAGDAVNGQYYTGKINMATNSLGTAILRDNNTSTTDYIFTAGDRGERQLRIQDTIVESLRINVTDYNHPSIYGYTADSVRNMPVGSSGNVELAGLVISYTDMAPEDPLPSTKSQIGLSKIALYQGDGVIRPAPVPMLRLAMKTSPAGAPQARLKSLQVKSSGTLNAAYITEVGFYADNTAAGQVGMFDGETIAGGPPTDFFISSGVYSAGSWRFDDLDVVYSTALNSIPRNFFLTVRVSSTAATPRSFAFAMDNWSFVTISALTPNIGVADNNFPIVTATAPVRNQPATIYIKGTDISAWWKPATEPVVGQFNYVDQGTQRAGMLKIQAWTDNFEGTIKAFRIKKQGTGTGTDLKSMRLFLDSDQLGDWTQGNGTFESSVDKEVTDPVNPPVSDPADPELFVLSLANAGAYGKVDGSTRTYFVVYEFNADAIVDLTHGARLDISGVSLIDGVVAAFSPIITSTVSVRATVDMVQLEGVNNGPPNNFSVPTSLTQNDANMAVARLTMSIAGTSGSAIWKGLKLDRWITADENGGQALYNQASDVARISVWQDATGDGLLQTSGDVKDIEVLLPSGNDRTFPVSSLARAMDNSTGSIRVADIQRYFPADSPFEMAPGRLIINDGQTDPDLKEVVYYNAVNVLENTFEGVTRGAEGTAAQSWSSGTVISGQAVLPLIGFGAVLDGQVLSPSAKDYFVTYTIAPLATVGSVANIGLAVRTTDYFSIVAPKGMSSLNIGVTPPGKSVSLVGRIREYADKVIITATDTVTGDTLQQKKINQPVISMTADAAVSDALWRWVMIYATGTVLHDGTALGDVSAVRVWRDTDRNGFLSAADVLIGEGAFGNTVSGPLAARVTFTTPERLYSVERAQGLGIAQRFFVTYDIKDTALPNDSLGRARSIGAYIKDESFPMGSPGSDDALKNAFSLPNYYDPASELPFISRVRAIVSSSNTVTVAAEPVFEAGLQLSLAAPRLTQPINTVDTEGLVQVTSTAGLPTAGYLLAGEEILHYDSLDPAFPQLLNVTRGQFGSHAAPHAAGTVLGTQLFQGAKNLPFLKMTMTAGGTGVRWESVKLYRTQPGGLTGYDSDVTDITIWKDSGNGLFDRDPATGLNMSDAIVGTGRFGVSPDPMGRATLTVADSLLGQPYQVVNSTASVYFVSMSISRTANFSHMALLPPNDVLGLEVPAESNFTFGPADVGHSAHFPLPVKSQLQVVMPTLNIITATPEDISPSLVTQAATNVGVLSLRMAADKTLARVEAIRLTRRGSTTDSDIDLVKVWTDANGNCILDGVDTATDAAGAYPHLMSYGNETYQSGSVNVVLKTPIVVTTAPACAFISYDISQFALPGSSAAVTINSPADFTIGIPNTLELSTWPVSTRGMLVQEVPSKINLGAYDLAASLRQSGVGQGWIKVPMLRFSLVTEAGNARWSSIRFQRTGSSNDPTASLGKNTDVKFISLYQDSNQNDQLDAGDLNLSEARTSLAEVFASTDTLPFQLVVESSAGFPTSGRLFLSEAELVTYSSTGTALSGKPYLLVTSRGDKLGDVLTSSVTHAAGASVRKVDLFDQVNMSATQIDINLAQVQTVNPMPKTFFAAYDIGETAVETNWVGLKVGDKSWLTVNPPHEMASQFYDGASRALPQGTRSLDYPVASSLVPVRRITLGITGTSAAPVITGRDSRNVPVLTLDLKSLSGSADYTAIGQIQLQQTGTISTTTAGLGEGDLTSVSLWKDNGDGVFSAAGDTRIGYVAHAATAPFRSGVAVDLSDGLVPYLVVSTAGVRVHVVCDISSSTDLSGADVMGHFAGLSISSFTDIRGIGGIPLAAAQVASYPIQSGQILIYPTGVLNVSGVNMAPDAVKMNSRNLLLLTLKLNTLSEYTAVGRLVLRQTGTIGAPGTSLGDGDLSAVSLWKDNGDGAFSSASDTLIGYTANSSTGPFKPGVTVYLAEGQVPYLLVSTQPVKVHVVCDISSSTDLSGASVIGHSAGLSLAAFSDIRDINGNAMAIGQYPLNVYPVASGRVVISPAVVRPPAVYEPIILAPNGYPAFAVTDSSGNLVLGPNGLPQADASRWIYNYPGTGCGVSEPLIDINGDGRPDNFDYTGGGKCVNISLTKSGKPSYNLSQDPKDQTLDYDFNGDNRADKVEPGAYDPVSNSTAPIYWIANDNDGYYLSTRKAATPQAWSSKISELSAAWDIVPGAVSYKLAVSNGFASLNSLIDWQDMGNVLSGKITGLALAQLKSGEVFRLTSELSGETSSYFTVLPVPSESSGFLWVGTERIGYSKDSQGRLQITARGADASPVGPHTINEVVSKRIYLISVRPVIPNEPESEGTPLMLYRIDTTAPVIPKAPYAPKDKEQKSRYGITWELGDNDDPESGVMAFEIQEREGTSPVWKTLTTVPAHKAESNNIAVSVGDPDASPGETARPLGKYYTYRARSWNYAGMSSAWSEPSSPAATQVATELLSKVSSFPNPVDLRKGGIEAKVDITYILNEDAEVTMTLYDLLGYVVMEKKYSSGQKGGIAGPNHVLWDGRNSLGGIVSKGGYIVRIKASSPKGSKIITRKIGVIH